MVVNVNYNDKKEQIAIQPYLHLPYMSEASGFKVYSNLLFIRLTLTVRGGL